MFTLAQLCLCEFPRLLLQIPFQLRIQGFLLRLCASSFLDRPAMSSGASNIANPSIARNVYGSQLMVTSHYPASRFNPAGENYTCTAASTGHANVSCPPLAPLPTSENLLAMIATTMEKMNADRGLPAMQVLKFDGSPENYPVFRRRFQQMVDSKALDGPTKMARLIQFLEGPTSSPGLFP